MRRPTRFEFEIVFLGNLAIAAGALWVIGYAIYWAGR